MMMIRIECFDKLDVVEHIFEIRATDIEDVLKDGELQVAVRDTVFNGGKVILSSRTYH